MSWGRPETAGPACSEPKKRLAGHAELRNGSNSALGLYRPNVRISPEKPDQASLFDHLVGAGEQLRRRIEAERPSTS